MSESLKTAYLEGSEVSLLLVEMLGFLSWKGVINHHLLIQKVFMLKLTLSCKEVYREAISMMSKNPLNSFVNFFQVHSVS